MFSLVHSNTVWVCCDSPKLISVVLVCKLYVAVEDLMQCSFFLFVCLFVVVVLFFNKDLIAGLISCNICFQSRFGYQSSSRIGHALKKMS